MKKIILSIAFLSIVHISFAQDTYKQDALKLIEIAGGVDTQYKMIEEQLKPNVPADKLTLIMADIKKELPALNNKIAAIYMEHYSHADIKEILAFYNTAVGKKMAKGVQEITPEVMKVSQEWGMSNLQGIVTKHLQ